MQHRWTIGVPTFFVLLARQIAQQFSQLYTWMLFDRWEVNPLGFAELKYFPIG